MSSGLDIHKLSVHFRTPHGRVAALSDLSLSLLPGEIVVLVGESGSGKTVLAHAIMGLLPRNTDVEGEVRLAGTDLLRLPDRELQRVRGRRISLVPQTPGAALNPVRRIGPQLIEAAGLRGIGRREAIGRLAASMRRFGLDWTRVSRSYPHELSGGMLQRAVNVLALLGEPEIVVADEPTHGLDADLVDTTAQHLATAVEDGAALLVITHDLRLAERLGGRLALLYASQLVEVRDTAGFFAAPAHPYGAGLLAALPERGGVPIPGSMPELGALPTGCAFASRCGWRQLACDEPPPIAPTDDGWVRCVHHARR